MRFAYDLKAKVVATRVGRIPAEIDSADYRMLLEVTNDVARHANHVGTVLAVTPSNDAPENISKFLKSITAGPMGVNFDPAAFVMLGQNPGVAARELHDLIVHVQARDAIRDVDGAGMEVPLGRGEVEWDELLALLHDAAYKGWLTVERTGGDDRIGDAARAIQFLGRVASG
jgi:sugar phosphate isomerase/epimerase